MSDTAKPYTRDEVAYWESMSEALPVNHRARLRATVEALDPATSAGICPKPEGWE